MVGHPFFCLSVCPDLYIVELDRYPAERLTRAQALKGMTLDAAYAAFAEDVLGSLSPGKRADYVILDRDIMDETKPVGEILKAQVKATIVDGKVMYGGVETA